MHSVTKVIPQENFTLHITFDNNIEKIFEAKPLLNINIFKPLQNYAFFKTVKPTWCGIEWNDEIDICTDVLYSEKI